MEMSSSLTDGGSRDIVIVTAARFVSQLHAASAGTSCADGSWTLVKLSLVSLGQTVVHDSFKSLGSGSVEALARLV